MHKLIQKVNYLAATLVFTFATLIAATPQALAASATLTLAPGSASASPGTIVSFGVYVNTGGDPVNAVQANLSYPANLLDYVSISSSGAFPVDAQSTGGGGSVGIARGALTPVSGVQLVATVRFKAKVSTGSASITFAGGSGVASNGVAILGGTNGATVAFKAPAAPTPAAPAAPAPPKDTTPPEIKDVKVSDVTTKSATITWTTSEPATSEVSYGLDANYGLSASDSKPVTEHTVVLNSAMIRPATTYHYAVKSVDPAGNVSAAQKDQSFTTVGLTAKVKVINQDSKPVSGATVQFQKSSAKTNAQGEANLSGLPTGKLTLVVTQGKKDIPVSATIVMSEDGTSANPVTLKVNVAASSPAKMIGIIAAIALIILAIYLIIRRMGKNNGGTSGVITPLPVLPTSDPDLKTAGPSSAPIVEDSADTSLADTSTKVTPTLPGKDNEPVIIKPDIVSSDSADDTEA